jgi:hypothetical protein
MAENEVKSVAMAVPLDAQSLISQAVASGAGIETLERLVALAKDVRAEEAKRAWHRAMAAFQRDCPAIKRSETAKIETRGGGSYSYTYAPLGEIMATILPVMGPLGLTVSYRTRFDGGRVIAAAIISHEEGHSENSGEVSMPIGAGATGANPAQCVGISSTYAKRYALLAVLGLSPEDDPDAEAQQKKPVEQPKRKSEQAPPSGDATAGLWAGKVVDLKVATGKTDKGPWTLTTAVGDDGSSYGTFDSNVAEMIGRAVKGGIDVEIQWERTKKGNLNIVAIQPFVKESDGQE